MKRNEDSASVDDLPESAIADDPPSTNSVHTEPDPETQDPKDSKRKSPSTVSSSTSTSKLPDSDFYTKSTDSTVSSCGLPIDYFQTSVDQFSTDGEHSIGPKKSSSFSSSLNQITFSRNTYNLFDFNATFQEGGSLAKSALSEETKYPKNSIKSRTISFLSKWVPIVAWLSTYQKKDLKYDVSAGLTVAVFQIPQCMGYSLLAKVPPIYGLYSSFLAPLFYATLGTSKHASIGTFAIISLMTGSIVADLSSDELFHPGRSEIEIATCIALMIGVYQTLFAVMRLGFLAQFMSEQLTSGFITASAFYVLSSQLGYISGIQHIRWAGTGPFALINFYMQFFEKVLTESNPATWIVSSICIVSLVILKFVVCERMKQSRRSSIRFLGHTLPSELILVVVFIVASRYFEFYHHYHIKTLGEVPSGLPQFTLPEFSWIWRGQLWRMSISLAIIAFAVTYSTGKTFATKNGYEILANQELLALGITNTVCSHFRCIPTAASLSRSALQESLGVRSQLPSIVNSLFVLTVLLYMSHLLEELPICVLASIIVVAMKSLFKNALDLKKYWQMDRIDASIWIVSFFAVLILNVDYGLYLGLLYSLGTLIAKSQRPKTYILGAVDSSDVYVPVKHYPQAACEHPGIKIFQFCGPLHFANVEYFKRKLAARTKIKMQMRHKLALPTALILDCSMLSYIDISGMNALRNLALEYGRLGIRVLLSCVATHVAQMMLADPEFAQALPSSQIYITVHDAVAVLLNDTRRQQPGAIRTTQENPFQVINIDDQEEVIHKVKKKLNLWPDNGTGHEELELLPEVDTPPFSELD